MDNTQRVSGTTQTWGPQPVAAAQAQATIAQQTVTGNIDDSVASNPGNATMNAKLGALMVQNASIIELLESIYLLLRRVVKDPDALDGTDDQEA